MTGAAAGSPAGEGRPPLGWLRFAAVAAGGYALAALVWVAFGEALPGGRWFAVHLFTVGILSNLVIALSEHFAETVLHTASSGNRSGRLLVWNAAALVLLAFPPSLRYPFTLAATVLVGVVVWLLVDLRRARRRSSGARFGFVVAAYQHACTAFLIGTSIGALLGLGVLAGPWYGAGRLAHLHANVLGWGGLTLLATVVFFAPTMLRTRIVAGAERRAAPALGLAAAGLSVAVAGLLATGQTAWAPWPRLVAAGGLVAYTTATAVVCRDVLRAVHAARTSAERWFVGAAAAWFVLAVGMAAFAVAAWELRLLDVAGGVLIVAVLGQAIVASLNYLNPMMWGVGAAPRAAVRERMQRFGMPRVLLLNVGVAAIAAAGLAGPTAGGAGALAARTGWALVAAAVVWQVGVLAAGAHAGRRRSPA